MVDLFPAISLLGGILAGWVAHRPRAIRPRVLSVRSEASWDTLMRGASVTNRSHAEIVAAHDTLAALVQGEVPPVTTRDPAELRAMLDVLCWTLGHDHNQRFDELLDGIADNLHDLGFVRMVIADPDGS